MASWNYVVLCSVLVVVLGIGTNVSASPDPYADAVAAFNPQTGDGKATDPRFQNPASALGAPDYDLNTMLGAVSLGKGGSITLALTDNALTGSGDSTVDLWIYEVGPDIEDTYVWISKDGTFPPLYPDAGWDDTTAGYIGAVAGSTSSIDIDAFGWGPGDYFTHVRLMDDPLQDTVSTGPFTGADIDAIECLSSVEIPEPLTMVSVLTGLALVGNHVRRRRRHVA